MDRACESAPCLVCVLDLPPQPRYLGVCISGLAGRQWWQVHAVLKLGARLHTQVCVAVALAEVAMKNSDNERARNALVQLAQGGEQTLQLCRERRSAWRVVSTRVSLQTLPLSLTRGHALST
jgi:hypothetical protein